ncbi:MAG TPA: isoprenylcysteine carboxylmethyltransferase family protein [Gemmatimonadaceae bacterium]|nr:isoprenylcysteine carboxylmethyltransferase family protein [Gemmatimonadaceae bacterium]
MTIIRHFVAILLLPFVMTVLVPRWLMNGYAESDTRWIDGTFTATLGRVAGTAILFLGLSLFSWCVALFGRVGQGTLAPWDPTKQLVVVGPYRFVRNPMISAVLVILMGESLMLGSRVVAFWAVAFFIINAIYFRVLEEPGLERRFGESYLRYKAAVPRWIPRAKPWKNA